MYITYWYIDLQEGKVEADCVRPGHIDKLCKQRLVANNVYTTKASAEHDLHRYNKILTKLERN